MSDIPDTIYSGAATVGKLQATIMLVIGTILVSSSLSSATVLITKKMYIQNQHKQP